MSDVGLGVGLQLSVVLQALYRKGLINT
jgi:hypothetical protein